MRIFCCILILSSLSLVAKGQMMRLARTSAEMIQDSATVKRKWEHTEQLLKNSLNDIVKGLLSRMMNDVNSVNISSGCIRDGMKIVGGIKKAKTWALRFLDSTAKSFDGMITGNMVSFGAYDECLDTVVYNQLPGKNKGKVMFTGKYCLLKIRTYMPPRNKTIREGDIMEEFRGIYERGTILSEAAKNAHYLYTGSSRMGLCIPSGCSADDVNQIFERVTNGTALKLTATTCDVKEEPKYSPIMIFVLTFFSLTGFVVLIGSLTDFYCSRSGKILRGKSFGVLLGFSLISSFRKLVSTSTATSTLDYLHGVRFLTMSWVILGHFYALATSEVTSGLMYIKEMVINHLEIEAIINANIAVDTFFFLGGFLVCYNVTKSVIIEGKNFSITGYILNRIWRLLPALIYVILYTFILELTAKGPMAHELIEPWVEGCKYHWWKTLLFINNYYGPTEGCLLHTWYLGVDMQLYIASLIIILPLIRRPKVGITLAAFLFAASIVVTGVETYLYHLPPTFLSTTLDVDTLIDFTEYSYYRPYTHGGVYIVGLMTGYFLATNSKLKIPKVIQVCGWCCAIIFNMAALYGTHDWNIGREPTLVETLFYGTCHRIAWSLGIAWMVVCCGTGCGGIVNYILSWKMWVPLARLTYCAYLLHVNLIIFFVGRARTSLPAHHDFLVWLYFGCLATTYGMAFIFSMLVETPFLSMKNLLLHQQSDKMKERDCQKESNHALHSVEDISFHTNLHSNLSAPESHKCPENGKVLYRL